MYLARLLAVKPMIYMCYCYNFFFIQLTRPFFSELFYYSIINIQHRVTKWKVMSSVTHSNSLFKT